MKKYSNAVKFFFSFLFFVTSVSFGQSSVKYETETPNNGQNIYQIKILPSNVQYDSIMFYPNSVNYWTGTCNALNKTDVSEVRTGYPEVGWMVFDISSIPNNIDIVGITIGVYLNNSNFPPWSATPMGNVNPVSDNAPAIYNQIVNNYDQSNAYLYNNEWNNFQLGFRTYDLGNNAVIDLQNSLSQGWFAVGFVSWSFTSGDILNFDGWNNFFPPYIQIDYVVPVELTSFNASYNNESVILNWQTATETNNKGFQIERKKINGNYEAIDFVNGHGTTTEPQTYSFKDKNIQEGTYKYRLKQIDYDGTYEYSKEVEVDVNIPLEFNLSQNYPNPFNPETKISYSLAVDSKVNLKIYDVLGRELEELINSEKSKGKHTVEFKASKLPSGIYFYRLEAKGKDGSNFISIKKMILMK